MRTLIALAVVAVLIVAGSRAFLAPHVVAHEPIGPSATDARVRPRGFELATPLPDRRAGDDASSASAETAPLRSEPASDRASPVEMKRRLPTPIEAVADAELNPAGRVLSIEALKQLAAFLQPRARPIAVLVAERDDRVLDLLEKKAADRRFETVRPLARGAIVQELRGDDGSPVYVSLVPGEDARLDELDRRIAAAITAGRREIAAFLAALP